MTCTCHGIVYYYLPITHIYDPEEKFLNFKTIAFYRLWKTTIVKVLQKV